MNGTDTKQNGLCIWCETRTANGDGICHVCRCELERVEHEWRITAECALVAQEFTSDTSPMVREFMDVSADDASDPGPEWQLAGIALTEDGARQVYVRTPAIARVR